MAAHDGDLERQMDVMREIHHAHVFRLLTQDLAGLLTVERLADHLSLAADLVLQVTVEACWRLVRTRHAETPRFAVIGYGKLGGKELGYASDLDIVFLYDDPHDVGGGALCAARAADERVALEPDQRGRAVRDRPRAAAERRLGAARLVGVGVPPLPARVGVDVGAPGAHARALLRRRRRDRRGVRGVPARRAPAEREPAKLAADVLAMRKRMLDGHPNRSGLFDLKHDRGGMVDIEFIVQYLVLAHSRTHYELTGNLGNIALLHMAGALGLVPGRPRAPRRRRLPRVPPAAARPAAERRGVRADRGRARGRSHRGDAGALAGGVRIGLEAAVERAVRAGEALFHGSAPTAGYA